MDQAEFLRFGIGALERLQIPYLVCGSVAAGAFGEPRILQVQQDRIDRNYIADWTSRYMLTEIWQATLGRLSRIDH